MYTGEQFGVESSTGCQVNIWLLFRHFFVYVLANVCLITSPSRVVQHGCRTIFVNRGHCSPIESCRSYILLSNVCSTSLPVRTLNSFRFLFQTSVTWVHFLFTWRKPGWNFLLHALKRKYTLWKPRHFLKPRFFTCV